MKAQLMLTCLCDAFYGEAAIATVKVLEHCGVEVLFPKDQTCCGQPAFNSGDWKSARRLTERVWEIFDPKIPVVVPSASCAAMLRHGVKLISLAECGVKSEESAEPHLANPNQSEKNVFELSEFLLDILKIDSWPQKSHGGIAKRKIYFHQSCHGRMIQLGDRQKRLLQMVPGLEIIELENPEQCCGFGGMFAAKQPHLSESIGLAKLASFQGQSHLEIVSGDMGCLMHLQTLATAQNLPLKVCHYAQILGEAL